MIHSGPSSSWRGRLLHGLTPRSTRMSQRTPELNRLSEAGGDYLGEWGAGRSPRWIGPLFDQAPGVDSPGDLLPWSTLQPQPGHSHCHYHALRCITFSHVHSTADPALDQMIDRALEQPMSLSGTLWRDHAISMTMPTISPSARFTPLRRTRRSQWDLGRTCRQQSAYSFGDSLHSAVHSGRLSCSPCGWRTARWAGGV